MASLFACGNDDGGADASAPVASAGSGGSSSAGAGGGGIATNNGGAGGVAGAEAGGAPAASGGSGPLGGLGLGGATNAAGMGGSAAGGSDGGSGGDPTGAGGEAGGEAGGAGGAAGGEAGGAAGQAGGEGGAAGGGTTLIEFTATKTGDAKSYVYDCPPGEAVVGVATYLVGAGYVGGIAVHCAAPKASGDGFDPPHKVGPDPMLSGDALVHCPAGTQIVGVIGAAAEYVERLGFECAPLGWSDSSKRTKIGPSGLWMPGSPEVATKLCTAPQAVRHLEVLTLPYLGQEVAIHVSATCE